METENYQIINKLENGFFSLLYESQSRPNQTIQPANQYKHVVDIAG